MSSNSGDHPLQAQCMSCAGKHPLARTLRNAGADPILQPLASEQRFPELVNCRHLQGYMCACLMSRYCNSFQIGSSPAHLHQQVLHIARAWLSPGYTFQIRAQVLHSTPMTATEASATEIARVAMQAPIVAAMRAFHSSINLTVSVWCWCVLVPMVPTGLARHSNRELVLYLIEPIWPSHHDGFETGFLESTQQLIESCLPALVMREVMRPQPELAIQTIITLNLMLELA